MFWCLSVEGLSLIHILLHELLSDEMRPTLLALCGGIGIIADGELCWTLPGHTYISVSYTHLDVYKRQIKARSDFFAGQVPCGRTRSEVYVRS